MARLFKSKRLKDIQLNMEIFVGRQQNEGCTCQDRNTLSYKKLLHFPVVHILEESYHKRDGNSVIKCNVYKVLNIQSSLTARFMDLYY